MYLFFTFGLFFLLHPEFLASGSIDLRQDVYETISSVGCLFRV